MPPDTPERLPDYIYTHLDKRQMARISQKYGAYSKNKVAKKLHKWVEKWVEGKKKNRRKPCGTAVLNGDPSGIRTPDTLIKSQVLYRLS